MQLYILDKDASAAAHMLPVKLKGKNYAQKMLIELGQCLSNLMGNKDFDERLYKYKAVPPQFTAFIFVNKEWVLEYYYKLAQHCVRNYENFTATDTWINFSNIHNLFIPFCSSSISELTHAWFVPQKEYSERKYLPVDECISEYKKYLEWKIKR